MARTKVTEPKVTHKQIETVEPMATVDRAEQVRRLILDTKRVIGGSYIDMALLAHEVDSEKYYVRWGYVELKDYAEQELDMKYRKLRYFVEIGAKAKELGLSKERLEAIGWSKVSLIAGILDADNMDEWLDRAEKMSTRKLAEEVKIRKVNDPEAVVPQLTILKLKLPEIIANVVMEAINTAKKLTNTDDMAAALEMICSDWLEVQNTTPERVTLQDKIDYINRVYGVNLIESTSSPTTPSIATTEIKAIEVEKDVNKEEVIDDLTEPVVEETKDDITDELDELLNA